ncbi:CGNR zinc finger domain-containing protein [Kribbella sp. NPDC051718]|uniref:CGNR zinc finger domain-containing protein n=1 Tax=Kribbella sp. NPDC051718 TaxID=3155168 RepID=UPI0034421632
MSSPATERYALDPAPDTLALAQDLLNTRGVGTQPDLLADLPSATAWISDVVPGEVTLTDADVEHLRTFRAELHRLVTPDVPPPEATKGRKPPSEAKAPGAGDAQQSTSAPASGPDLASDPASASASAWSAVAAELVLGADGVVELRAGGRGAEYVISRVLAEVLAGQQVDTWRRLKACKNDRCRVVFYDRSRNNSGVWHSLKTCGNPANLRAFRARNKETSS